MRTLLPILVIVVGCGTSGGGGDDGEDTPTDPPFEPAVTRIAFEIDYETGQEPYTGPILGFGDTFDVSVSNFNRLFANKKTLTLPTTLAQMEDLGAIVDEELTVTDLLALTDAHRSVKDGNGTRSYYVIFVSGHFADANGVNNAVLGVSLGNTGVIAMFKDTIRSTNIPAFPNVVRFVEQSTLIHEGAHAVGLVDNGVALASAHKDATHGAHCNNDKCVMYWANEGASDAAQFAQKYVIGGDTILFDAACLADVDALTGGL